MTTPGGPPSDPPQEAWPGSGPPPPTWGTGDPGASSDAVGPWPGGDLGDPPAGDADHRAPRSRLGAASGAGSGAPRYGVRRLVAAGVALVVVALVVGLVVFLSRDDSTSSSESDTTLPSGVTVARSGLAALRFQPYTSANPAFSMSTPGPVRRVATAAAIRYGPAAGSTARWTLEVRQPTTGVDVAAAAKQAVERRRGTATPTADTGSPGPHVDDLVTGADGGKVLLHVAQGTNNLFILWVPFRSGGTQLTGRAVFNQLAGTLRALGIE